MLTDLYLIDNKDSVTSYLEYFDWVYFISLNPSVPGPANRHLSERFMEERRKEVVRWVNAVDRKVLGRRFANNPNRTQFWGFFEIGPKKGRPGWHLLLIPAKSKNPDKQPPYYLEKVYRDEWMRLHNRGNIDIKPWWQDSRFYASKDLWKTSGEDNHIIQISPLSAPTASKLLDVLNPEQLLEPYVESDTASHSLTMPRERKTRFKNVSDEVIRTYQNDEPDNIFKKRKGQQRKRVKMMLDNTKPENIGTAYLDTWLGIKRCYETGNFLTPQQFKTLENYYRYSQKVDFAKRARLIGQNLKSKEISDDKIVDRKRGKPHKP